MWFTARWFAAIAVFLTASLLLAWDEPDSVGGVLVRGFPPTVAHLSPERRKAALEQLQKEQVHASGRRAQEIAFSLAALGANYSVNRNYLVDIFRRCGTPMPGDCDEDTAALLIGLHAAGPPEVLKSLLDAGARNPDGSLAEILGSFYSEALKDSPRVFVNSLEQMPIASQSKVCSLAGSGDGGGLAAEDLRTMRASLTRIGGAVALRCADHIGTASGR
jgi:hypothetical protein